MVVKFRFCNPLDPSEMRSLVSRLNREESAYFKDMQIKPKEKMSADKFVRLIHPWQAHDRQEYATEILPVVAEAVDDMMSEVVGRRVFVEGTISFARLDTRVESGFPFTLLDYVFLSMPRSSETTNLKIKTATHECAHILQRYFPDEFHKYYLRTGFIQVPCPWIERVRKLGDSKYTTISNPDTFRARLYAVPLSKDGKTFVVTNLAIEPETEYYRELAFVIDNGQIRAWDWLHKLMPTLKHWPGIPSKSVEALSLMSEHHLEGHPHEIAARYLEGTGLRRMRGGYRI